MQIELKALKGLVKKLSAVVGIDSNASYVHIIGKPENNILLFELTNNVFTTIFKFESDTVESFETSVDSKSFIDIINGLTGEFVDLDSSSGVLNIISAKSKYKLALIYEGDHLRYPAPFNFNNTPTHATISAEILQSIDDVNTKEILRVGESKIKSEAGSLYHLTNSGCFTSANTFGACLNSFILDSDVDLLINRQIVKLFKLFTSDVDLYYSLEMVNSAYQSKICLKSDDLIVNSYLPAAEKVRAAIMRMTVTLRTFLSANYQCDFNVKAEDLIGAVTRLTTAIKHTSKYEFDSAPLYFTFYGKILAISDENDNIEQVDIENNGIEIAGTKISLSVQALKLFLDSCNTETIRIKSDLNKMIILNFDNVSYFLSLLD